MRQTTSNVQNEARKGAPMAADLESLAGDDLEARAAPVGLDCSARADAFLATVPRSVACPAPSRPDRGETHHRAAAWRTPTTDVAVLRN
jgi:hypothetical protein